jgi:hypothetical protein
LQPGFHRSITRQVNSPPIAMEDRLLLLFSLAFSLWAVAAMAIPYIRGQADLLTARNFFLLGALLYVGFSGVKASREGHFYDYSQKVYLQYYVYIVVFFVVFSLAYRKLQWPRRAAARRFLTWPQQEGIGLWFPMALTLTAMLGQIILVQVPGVRALLVRVGVIAPAFALVFALAIWKRNKLSPVSVALVAIVFFAGAYLSFSSGGGRRFLYALAIAAPVCFYWWTLRYRRPLLTMSIFAVVLAIWPIADSAYRAARWYGFSGRAKTEDVGAATRWRIFKDSLFATGETFGQSALQIGQTTVENMLLTTYIFGEGHAQFPDFYVKPLHSLYVLTTLPFPRALWEDKPISLGITLPYDSGILTKEVARTNWGPGIVAHAVHDGGIPAAILYAVIIGLALRFVDELLVRHPGNPFLLGFLCSASVQIAAFIRGDLATMSALALLCFVFMIALAWATKMVVGAEANWAKMPGSDMVRRRAYR